MLVAAALAVVILFVAAGLAWAARLVHVGNLDAQELADKLGMPDPVSALDWPELRVRAVITEPGDRLVLLRVGWPAHPRRAAMLLVDLDGADQTSLPLLSRWCATGAPVSPTRLGTRLELRRRQSLERVHAVLVAEERMAAPPGGT
jgi:hypothetical protein